MAQNEPTRALFDRRALQRPAYAAHTIIFPQRQRQQQHFAQFFCCYFCIVFFVDCCFDHFFHASFSLRFCSKFSHTRARVSVRACVRSCFSELSMRTKRKKRKPNKSMKTLFSGASVLQADKRRTSPPLVRVVFGDLREAKRVLLFNA